MSKTHWLGGDGDWGTGALWSGGVPNSASSNAVIAAAGVYTVAIATGERFTAGSVKLAARGATLLVDGSLTLAGTLTVAVGSLDLAAGGVISGGTIATGAGTIAFSGGTLAASHVVGPLNIDANNGGFLVVTGGLSVAAAGGGAGQVNLISAGILQGALLDFSGSQTFDNATISFANATTSLVTGAIENTGTLTIGAHANLVDASLRLDATLAGAAYVNDGTITDSAQFGYIDITAAAFTNNGEVRVTGANSTFLAEARNFINAAGGMMEVGASDQLRLGAGPARGQPATQFDNLGTIIINAGGTLRLAGAFDAGDIGAVVNNGTLELDGVLNNTGGTLALGSGDLGGTIALFGTIHGGVVVADPIPAKATSVGTLDGVTWRGTLDLGARFETAIVENGLTVTGAGGTGPGMVLDTGVGSALYFTGDQTFDNATITLGDATGGSIDAIRMYTAAGAKSATLTLGGNLTILANVAGAEVTIESFAGAKDMVTVVNDGTILASGAGGRFSMNPTELVNNGRISISNGDEVLFNTFGTTVNTGTIDVGAGASLLIEAGAFGSFSNTGKVTVAAGGTLDVAGAYIPAALGAIQNDGTFIIDGAIAGQTITIGSGPIFGGQLTVLGINGHLDGGTLVLGGGPIAWRGGDLSNLQVQGTVDMSAAGANVFLDGGVTLTGAGGTGPGAINLTGAGAILDFLYSPIMTTQSLDNATITVGHAGATDAIEIFTVKVQAHTLTFGAGVIIDANVAASTVMVDDSGGTPDTLISHGAIHAGAAGGALIISIATLANDGLLAVSNGDAVTVSGAVFGAGAMTLGSGARLTLGVVGAGQNVTFSDGTAVLTLNAPGNVAATIHGFQNGDRIDLTALPATSLTLDSHNRLIVMNGATAVATLQLAGHYTQSQFTLTGDGAGGSLITTGATAMVQAMAALAPAQAAFAITPRATTAPLTMGLLHGGI